MNHRTILLGILLFASVVSVQPSHAQEAQVLHMDISVNEDFQSISTPGIAIFEVTIRDQSIDGTGGIENAPVFGLNHNIRYLATPAEEKRGWVVQTPPGAVTRSGEEVTAQFRILNTPAASDPFYSVNLTVEMSAGAETIYRSVNVVAYTQGLAGFNAQSGSSFLVKPGQIDTSVLKITNAGLYPRVFGFEVANNPCNVGITPPSSVVVGAKATEEVPVSVRGPEDKGWYFTESCAVTLRLIPADNPNIEQTVILGGQVNGGYFNPVWAFWAVAIVFAIILLIFIVADRKARIEEELLGKPQRPWTIPVEAVYLKHLKERDPRAHYVVRHFLMEEEYQSSLLWYKDFKRATSGGRSKERLVVQQEHKLQRFEKRWKRRVARPVVVADRFENRLQKKLDREGKGALRKQHRKWRKTTKKMQLAHDAKVTKATEKWKKQAARAEKKGKPVPEAPAFSDPDYPREPSLDRLLLADHKWNKKAQRFRRKQMKRQGNLEVKYEKKEARLLRKVRRRVDKVARKLDDPDFAAEHPLLGGKAAAKAAKQQQQ